MDYIKLGDKLKAVRKKKGLTQKALGEAVGRTESSIAKYERGLVEMPMSTLQQLAAALGIGVNELIWESEREKDQLTGISARLVQLEGFFDNSIVINSDYSTETGMLNVSISSRNKGDEYTYKTVVKGAENSTKAMEMREKEVMEFLITSAVKISSND